MASRKPTAKKQKKAVKPVKKKPARAKQPAPRKQAPAPKKKAPVKVKKPPMHATVTHPELDDGAHDETFEIFKTFDRDGSGSIDAGELARLLEALGQRPDELELAIALDVVDANRSGRISWDEFKAWWAGR